MTNWSFSGRVPSGSGFFNDHFDHEELGIQPLFSVTASRAWLCRHPASGEKGSKGRN